MSIRVNLSHDVKITCIFFVKVVRVMDIVAEKLMLGFESRNEAGHSDS